MKVGADENLNLMIEEAYWTGDLLNEQGRPLFENQYSLSIPSSGDGTPLALSMAIAVLSAVGTLTLSRRRKQR